MKARHLLAAIAAVAALAACSRDLVAPSSTESSSRETIFSTKNIVRPVSVRRDMLPVSGEPVSVQSSYDIPTKTHLEMNSDGSYADVVWDAGDSFWMVSYSDGLYYTIFSTSSGGRIADFTSSGTLPSSEYYYSVYPSISAYADLSEYGYGLCLITKIPSVQTAVAGGFLPGTNPSFALSGSADEHLRFYNAGALLKFSISGELVSSINSVTLKGNAPISGDDCDIMFLSDGSVSVYFDLWGEGVNRITLNGPFTAGEDYYIVLAPGTQDSLTLTFEGDEGSVSKSVNQSIDFPRGMIRDFGTIDIGNSFPEYDGPEATLYMGATAGLTKPVTLVVVPDGFTKEELSDFDRLAKSGINALFNTEPFKTYKSCFNVWLISVASNESGASITDGDGNITTARDCYFGSKWGEDSYGDMDLDYNILYDFVSDYCPDIKDGTHAITEVPVLVIINDERYGGICHSWSDGLAYCQAPVTSGGGSLAWGYPDITAKSDSDPSLGTRETTSDDLSEVGGYNYGDWRNTLVHEYGGHAFSRLGDEYWYDDIKSAVSSISRHSWPVPFSLNISAKYSTPPWKSDLLERKDQLVSSNPLYSRLGVYQGGDVSPLNRWRCEKISCMIDNRFYFSIWQRELIVKRIMSLAGSTFDLSQFLSLDVPTDPNRDMTSSGVMGQRRSASEATAPIMPPLPPPVLHD